MGWASREPEKSCVDRVKKPEWGKPASKCPWPERIFSGPTGARKRMHETEEARKLRGEIISDRCAMQDGVASP